MLLIFKFLAVFRKMSIYLRTYLTQRHNLSLLTYIRSLWVYNQPCRIQSRIPIVRIDVFRYLLQSRSLRVHIVFFQPTAYLVLIQITFCQIRVLTHHLSQILQAICHQSLFYIERNTEIGTSVRIDLEYHLAFCPFLNFSHTCTLLHIITCQCHHE